MNVRHEIIALSKNGFSQKEISKRVRWSKQVVSYTIKRYNETGSVKTDYTKETANICRVRKAIKRKPRQSARKLSKKLKLNREVTEN